MLKGKNILITGGEGFIGTNLVEALSKQNNVKTFDIKSGKDIKDIKLLMKETKNIDILFHLASLVSVEESIKNPSKYIENNFFGGCNVLRAAIENNVERFVFSSSASVYGNLPGKEDAILIHKSPYALLKAMFERYMDYCDKKIIEVVSLRLFNVYGPGQKLNSEYSAVIPTFISNALKNKSIVIFGDGRQTRDFIHINDVVKACCLAAEKGSGIFNIGSGKSTSINELADVVIKLTGTKSKKTYKNRKQGDVITSVADIAKAKKVFGFIPEYDIIDGLKHTIKWFRNNDSR